MGFQWLIDNCESLSIDNRLMVAQTTARNGIVRSVSRGAQPRRFVVKLPDGPRWSEIHEEIAALMALDRVTSETIQIKYSLFPWYYGNVNPGTNDSYTVLCVEMPTWTIFARDQVSWSGPFILQEYVADGA